MNTFRKIKKNSKALSPVVASIILIAVTVAVSIVVAAWMGGMTIGLMGTAEQGVITNLEFKAVDPQTITATVQNTGDVSLTITGSFVNGVTATSDVPADGLPIAQGTSATVIITYSGTLPPVADGNQYQVKLTTTNVNAIAYTSTCNAP